VAIWDFAEAQLAEALDEFAGVGQWRVNAGDGAFYGPKIDIKVYDAMERIHQCATVQLGKNITVFL
jgi:threonyl-tRNA synthetase